MVKAILLIGGKRYDITNFLKNWDEVEMSAKRKDLGGVVRTFSNKFEFVKGAYDLIEAEYLANYTKASAVLVIAALNNQWTYNEKFRCQLDFSTYQSDGSVITLNAIDDSIAATINANKSQVYDMPVEELKSQELYYDRMDLLNRVSFSVNPNAEEEQTETGVYPIKFTGNYEFPMVYQDINFPVKGKIEPFDTGGYAGNSSEIKPFIKAISPIVVDVKIKFKITTQGKPDSTATRLLLWIMNEKDERVDNITILLFPWDGKISQVDYSNTINLNTGYSLKLFFDSGTLDTIKAKIYDVEALSVSYIARNQSVNIDAFTPSKLLTSILHKMGLPQTTGMIEEGSMPIPWMLAAESIRGITNAKVHTSFKKFADFAKAVLGYEYEIAGNRVVFKHISSFYDNSQIKDLEFVNSLELSVDESKIYSGVDVGFEKKDYDEINGRDEFHFTNSFSTSLSITDNVLKLISPYRADCYGIEFLAQKREEETKDDNSDNDLFIVDAKQAATGDYLVLNRDTGKVTGVLFPDTIFNTVYSPRRMLVANKKYIGACTSHLDFTASNGNADVTIGGISEKERVTITSEERLFRTENLKVDTEGLHPFPATYKGLISFSYAGRTYEGYVSEITEKIGKTQTVSYALLSQNIT